MDLVDRSTSPIQSGVYLLALALAGLAYLVADRLRRAPLGRAWAATREDEIAAAASGEGVASTRVLAFGIEAWFAGLAGALMAANTTYLETDQFDFTLSLMVLAAVVIGRRWGVPGAGLGARLIAADDRLLIEGLAAVFRPAGITIDLRGQSFAAFGQALDLAVLPWGKIRPEWAPPWRARSR